MLQTGGASHEQILHTRGPLESEALKVAGRRPGRWPEVGRMRVGGRPVRGRGRWKPDLQGLLGKIQDFSVCYKSKGKPHQRVF